MKSLISKIKLSKFYAILIGLLATIWFLVRVIPKPTRAKYPCMQAAAPLMSAFIIYLLGISASYFSFKKFKKYYKSSKYVYASLFLIIALICFVFGVSYNKKDAFAKILVSADNTFPINSNEPIGEAKGLMPGRVVWVHDDNATNQNYLPEYGSNDFWYEDHNVDEETIKLMLSTALRKYTNTSNTTQAWDALFKSFNSSTGRGNVGYSPGEKIAFKINLTNQSIDYDQRPERMDATPQLLNAILDELVNTVGVAEGDITLGDPYREFRNEYVDIVMAEFPDVNYVDGAGNHDGVIQTEPTSSEILVFSDGNNSSTLPKYYVDATYMINIPCLKTHDLGGITLIAKNHQGSYLKSNESPRSQYAVAMHYSLPGNSSGTGQYRHTVDYMSHEQTGGKALLYIVDGIWAGDGWEGFISKFQSDPFNNDYPNSIFLGQDPVALESVCFDILFNENVEDGSKNSYPIFLKEEIADYLSQMASSDYWPSGIQYDPEGDGSVIGSLGVFEHWNNPLDRKYSKNLGTGNGIELIYTGIVVDVNELQSELKFSPASPNPFIDKICIQIPKQLTNNVKVEINSLSGKQIKIFNAKPGEIVYWDATDMGNNKVKNGLYIYNIIGEGNKSINTGKIIYGNE